MGDAVSFEEWLAAEMRRRFWHRSWTERPYEDCRCSDGGPCEPKDPAERQVCHGLASGGDVL